MGTNFYWHPRDPCETCRRPFESIHIGKSSAGWCFLLHVTDDLRSLDDWKERWKTGRIVDEYGVEYSPDEMIERIVDRSNWSGTTFDRQWLRANHAVPGPYGLARCAIDGQLCVGHGDGTWDLIPGEFS